MIDRGAGIDPEAMHRIFEPLEQAESLNTRTHQGVGLGLTLARMSANAMEGDVVLESTGPRARRSCGRSRAPPPGLARSERPARSRRYLKRRMCTFSRMPIATKFTSIAVPP